MKLLITIACCLFTVGVYAEEVGTKLSYTWRGFHNDYGKITCILTTEILEYDVFLGAFNISENWEAKPECNIHESSKKWIPEENLLSSKEKKAIIQNCVDVHEGKIFKVNVSRDGGETFNLERACRVRDKTFSIYPLGGDFYFYGNFPIYGLAAVKKLDPLHKLSHLIISEL